MAGLIWFWFQGVSVPPPQSPTSVNWATVSLPSDPIWAQVDLSSTTFWTPLSVPDASAYWIKVSLP